MLYSLHRARKYIGSWAGPLALTAISSLSATGPVMADPLPALTCTPPATDPEVSQLARALEYNPTLIYEYIYYNVDYSPTWGLKKNALTTILDKRGNNVDQNALFVALLRQSCVTANFRYGTVALPNAMLASLFGVANDTGRIGEVLGGGGIAATLGATSTNINMVWTEFTYNGTTLDLDPSLKSYVDTPPIDLATAMGYSHDGLLASALGGSSAVPGIPAAIHSIHGVNRAALAQVLNQYSQNLADYIRANKPSGSTADVYGGRTITNTNYGVTLSNGGTVYADLPASFETVYRLSVSDQPSGSAPSLTATLYASQIGSKRLTLTYDAGAHPVLSLEGVAIATGAATSSARQYVSMSVDNPYPAGTTFATYSAKSSVVTGGSYAWVLVAGEMGRDQLTRHQDRGAKNAKAGMPDEAITGESLAALGAAYVAQLDRIDRLYEDAFGAVAVTHETMGIAGKAQSAYVDFPGRIGSASGKTTAQTDADFLSVLLGSTIEGSALESTAVTQLQNNPAVSTARFFDYANAAGDGVLEANAGNWSQVNGMVTGWSAGDQAAISAYLAANPSTARVFIPTNGHRTIGGWVGGAYYESHSVPNQTFVGAIISAGYSGGYGTLPGFDAALAYSLSYYATQQFGFPSPMSLEPVDLHSGSYTYDRGDLDVGSGDYPFHLSLKRSYDSSRTTSLTELGAGWRHNFAMSASIDSDSFESFGDHSALAAVPFVVANYAVKDLSHTATPDLTNTVVASLASSWLMDQLVGNAVTLDLDGGTKKFIRIPTAQGSLYIPPPADTSTLVVNTDRSMVLTDKLHSLYAFDTDGKISQWQDSNHNIVSFTYVGSGAGKHLSKVSNGMGATLTFTYNGNLLSSVTDGYRPVFYTYSGNDLSSVKDASHLVTTFSYDGKSHLVSVFYPARPTTAFVTNTYDPEGRVVTQADASGNLWTYLFARGERSEEIDPQGNSHVLYFDPVGNRIQDTDQTRYSTLIAYDGIGRAVRTTYPAGDGELLTYDDQGNVIAKVRQPIPGAIDPLTGDLMAPLTQSWTYDPVLNKVVTETNARGDVTSHTYDATGNLLSTTKPAVYSPYDDAMVAPVSHYAYNARGQLTQVTDPEGMVSTKRYDTAGNVVAETTDTGTGNLNLSQTYEYDIIGNRLSVTDADGNTARYTFDNSRNLVTELPPPAFINDTTSHAYNADGREIKVGHATGDPTRPELFTTTDYDSSGRVIRVTQPDGTYKASTYDTVGRLATETSSSGRKATYGYDAASRVISTTEQLVGPVDPSITQDLGPIAKERRTYYSTGDVATEQDANGNTLTYYYDGFKRREHVLFPDGTDELHAFDSLGKEEAFQQRSGNVIWFHYDALGRMIDKQPDGCAESVYGYDLTGRPVADVTAGGLSLIYYYDSAGRPTGESRTDIGAVTWTLDGRGDRKTTTWPGLPAYSTTQAFDSRGRLTDVYEGQSTSGTRLAHYDYDPLSRRTDTLYGPGSLAKTVFNWTDGGQVSLISHTWQGGGVDFSYTYNADHQRASLSVDDPSFVASATPAGTATYSVNSQNQYLVAGGSGLSYDLDGNLTGDGTWTYTYDLEKHLVTATRPGTTVSYAYDAVGRRASKTVNGVTTRYLSVGNVEMAEYDDAGNAERRYVYGPALDEPLVMVDASGTRSYHLTDGLGSTVGLLSDAGDLTESHAYDSYGATSGSASTPFLFAGRRLDTETGLYHNRARAYSTSLGRFLQTDPSGTKGGFNLYAYAGNDPINITDPTGLRPGDIYAVTPATIGFLAILTTNINVFGQRLAGAWGTGYSHAAIEIGPAGDGSRQIAESEPSGLRIRTMDDFMADAAQRGSVVDRYSDGVPASKAAIGALTDISEANQGAPYNFWIFFTDRSDGKFTCADFCDYAAYMAHLPPINDKASYGLAPLPSDLSNSPNYHLSTIDWPGK